MLAIEIKELCKTYSPDIIAVDKLSLKIKAGSFFALLGPNGAGKSSTIGIISSLVQKTSGLVKIFGFDIDHQLEKAKACIGIVPQEYNFSIFETPINILINQAGYYGIPRSIASDRATKYLNLLGLEQKKNVSAGQLSGGMKRRLMVARAMMHHPKILILDEPTAGLDIEARHLIWNFLSTINDKENVTIILTTHYLEEAERLCDSVAIINNGVITTQGKMEEILRSDSKQIYIAELTKPVSKLPKPENINIKQLDLLKLELEFSHSISLSEVIIKLSSENIDIASLYSSTSKLEELFLNVTRKNDNGN